MNKKVTRPSANLTRSKILDAAKSLFLKKGFDATHIKEIAALAKVNTNLIFHHFTNKETLWHQVRDLCLSDDIPTPNYNTTSGEGFFKSIIDYRFELYLNNPEFTKIIKWGSLASQEQDLVSKEDYSPIHWLPLIRNLQKKGLIKKTTTAENIMLFIVFSSYAPFWQEIIPLNPKQAEQYKNMLIEMCCKQFISQS
jgi:AcrR family transcriptional regulator